MAEETVACPEEESMGRHEMSPPLSSKVISVDLVFFPSVKALPPLGSHLAAESTVTTAIT